MANAGSNIPKRQITRLAGHKSDQKYRRINISDLLLGSQGPPAALGMFEPASRLCLHIPTSGPREPCVRTGQWQTGPPGLGADRLTGS